jgi:hypothetical protein
VNPQELQAWAVLSIAIWNADAAVRLEFENVSDFADWAQEEVDRLILSAVGRWQ